MIENEAILITVKKVVRNTGRFSNVDLITETTELVADGYLDSLSMMTLLLELEREHQRSIPLTKITADNTSSVLNIVKMLNNLA